MPIVKEEAGVTLQVAIPVDIAYPELVAWVRARSSPGDVERLARLKLGTTPFVENWKTAVVVPDTPPTDVYLPEVDKTVVSGQFEHAGKTYRLVGQDDVAQRLRTGEPVVATFQADKGTSSEVLRLIPGVASITDAPERVRLDPGDISHLVAGDALMVPGIGALKIELSQSDGQRLLRQGCSTARVKVGDQTRDILLETTTPRTLARIVHSDDMVTASALANTNRARPWVDERITDAADASDATFLNPSFVVYVPIIQRWKSLGYERGTLLNTFSLAPREEVTVEVFSWDRNKTGTEATTSFESQRTDEATFSRKLTDTVVDTASHSWGWQFGANAGFQVPQINLNVAANFSIDNRNQTSQQHTVESINDGTVKVATMLKSSLQTKVTEAREFGTENRTTRKFQNPNLGRILHFDCFEVLHRFEVTTEYDFPNARLCVLVPFNDFLQALEPSETKGRAGGLLMLEGMLFDAVPERLRGGFDAARLYMAWDRLCQFSCDSACECAKPADPKMDTVPTTDTNPWEADLIKVFGRIVEAIAKLRAATGHLMESSLGPFPGGKAWKNCTADERADRQSDWHRFLFRRLVLERQLSGFWSECVTFFNLPVLTTPFADRRDAFERMKDRLIPSVADFLSPIFAAVSIPLTMMDALINGMGEFSSWVMPDLIKEGGFDDAGLQMAMIRAIELDDKWGKVEDDKKPKPKAATEPPPPPPADAKPPLRSEAEAFSPEALAAASVSIDALVSFLLINRSAYRVLIWNALNPVDRLRFLGLLGEVGKYVQTTVIGFVGDSIAVEVDPKTQDEFAKWLHDHLVTWQSPKTSPAPVALPVPGMTMQTRLEHCDALEPFLSQSREIELQRLKAIADQQDVEVARLKARIEKNMLDDPDPALPPIRVETVTADAPK